MDGTIPEEADKYRGARSSRPVCYTEVTLSSGDEVEGVS